MPADRSMWTVVAVTAAVLLAGCGLVSPSGGQVTESTVQSEPPPEPPNSSVWTPAAVDEIVTTPSPPRGPREDIDVARVERLLVTELNDYRGSSRPPVLEDPQLSAIARNHSHDMAERGYFAHEGPDGNDGGDRLRQAGYGCINWGETLTKTYWKTLIGNEGRKIETESVLAVDVVAGLADSPPHQSIISGSEYDTVGVGIYVTSDGTVFVTLLFCETER